MNPPMHKREFLKSLGGTTIAAMLPALVGPALSTRAANLSAFELARDEEFWTALRGKYRLNPDYINLENGYYSMMAQPVLEAYLEHIRAVNYRAAHYMRRSAEAERELSRAALARVAGCDVEELAITRNTTESLDLVFAGHDWRQGDEVVFAEQDYGTMQSMLELLAARHGIVCRRVSVPLDPKSDAELVELYAAAFTPRTRLLLVPHMINITGHILPVAKIAARAREQGIFVAVDGAHAFAHLEFRIPDLGVDAYAASLHKWLGCPLGAGLLWVKKSRIEALWPLIAPPANRAKGDIRKLNHLGTHPVQTDLGLRDAIAFHEEIGIARKEARLRHLKQYWLTRLVGRPRIRINTPSDPARSCGIGNVGIEGLRTAELEKRLFEEHRIFVVGIDTAGVDGVRVTPHLYTTESELDRFVDAMRRLAAG